MRWLLLALAACGRIGFAPIGGGGAGIDAAGGFADASCTFGPWGAVRSLMALDTLNDDWGASLSDDHLEIVYSSIGAGTQDLFRASRTTPTGTFTDPALMAASTAAYDDNPFVSRDGLTLWFDDDSTGRFELYTATRPSLADDFSNPQIVAELVSSDSKEAPTLSADELTLYFDDTHIATRKIFRAQRATRTSPFAPATVVSDVDAADACCPTLAPDGSLIFLVTPTEVRISAPNGNGGFLPSVAIPEIKHGADGLADVSITRDGTSVVFAAVAASADLYEIDRTCQ